MVFVVVWKKGINAKAKDIWDKFGSKLDDIGKISVILLFLLTKI